MVARSSEASALQENDEQIGDVSDLTNCSLLTMLAYGMRNHVASQGRDLSLRQISILFLLHDGGSSQRCSNLGRALQVPSAAVTRAIDRLAREGLVGREWSLKPGAKRPLMRLTEAGLAEVAQWRSNVAFGAEVAAKLTRPHATKMAS